MGCQNSKTKRKPHERTFKKQITQSIWEVKENDGQFEKHQANEDLVVEKTISSVENVYYYYDFIDRIGKGAYGSVWSCQRKSDPSQKVAIKIISTKMLKYHCPVIIQRELSILKSMDHPNICKFQETYMDSNYIYIVTELLNGGTLKQRLDNGEKFSEMQIAKKSKQLLWALNYLHSQHIVHRDLKLENIVFSNEDKDSDLKIIDFGISKKLEHESHKHFDIEGTHKKHTDSIAIDQSLSNSAFQKKVLGQNNNQIQNEQQLQQQNSNSIGNNVAQNKNLQNISKQSQFQRQNTPLVGSYFYRAPEVIGEELYDTSCDVWSLGIIIYTLFSSTFPFLDEDEIFDAQIDFQSNSVWRLVSFEAKDLISQMLHPDPLKRITVKEALEHAWFKNLKEKRLSAINLSQNFNMKKIKILEKITRFQGYAAFKKIILEIIVKRKTSEQIDPDVKELFEKLDTEKNGHITAQNLKNYLVLQGGSKISLNEVNCLIQKMHLTQSKFELKKFATNRSSIQFQQFGFSSGSNQNSNNTPVSQNSNQTVDNNGRRLKRNSKENGYLNMGEQFLNYTEFLAATMDESEYLHLHLLQKLFQYFDVREQQHIDIVDITTILSREGRQLPPQSLRAIFREMQQYFVKEYIIPKDEQNLQQENQNVNNEENIQQNINDNKPSISKFEDIQFEKQGIFGFNSFCQLMGYSFLHDQVDLEIKKYISEKSAKKMNNRDLQINTSPVKDQNQKVQSNYSNVSLGSPTSPFSNIDFKQSPTKFHYERELSYNKSNFNGYQQNNNQNNKQGIETKDFQAEYNNNHGYITPKRKSLFGQKNLFQQISNDNLAVVIEEDNNNKTHKRSSESLTQQQYSHIDIDKCKQVVIYQQKQEQENLSNVNRKDNGCLNLAGDKENPEMEQYDF